MVVVDSSSESIIIALIALLGTLIGAIIFVVKYFIKAYGDDIREHTLAATKLATASDKMSRSVDKNTKSNQEVLTFMKNLNGKLARATALTIQEQNVEHQHIEHSDSK